VRPGGLNSPQMADVYKRVWIVLHTSPGHKDTAAALAIMGRSTHRCNPDSPCTEAQGFQPDEADVRCFRHLVRRARRLT
jgi:hypothetical protein